MQNWNKICCFNALIHQQIKTIFFEFFSTVKKQILNPELFSSSFVNLIDVMHRGKIGVGANFATVT